MIFTRVPIAALFFPGYRVEVNGFRIFKDIRTIIY
jgi:hypothetical protein